MKRRSKVGGEQERRTDRLHPGALLMARKRLHCPFDPFNCELMLDGVRLKSACPRIRNLRGSDGGSHLPSAESSRPAHRSKHNEKMVIFPLCCDKSQTPFAFTCSPGLGRVILTIPEECDWKVPPKVFMVREKSKMSERKGGTGPDRRTGRPGFYCSFQF